MKKLLTALILISSCLSHAQDISIKTRASEVFKDNKKNTTLLFSESDGQGGFITVREFRSGSMQLPKGYYIDHFDADLKYLKETEIAIDNSQIQGLMVQNGSIYTLESQVDKKAGVYNFNVLESLLDSFSFQKRTLFSFDESDLKKHFNIGLAVIFVYSGFNQNVIDAFGEVTFSANKNFFGINFDIKDKESQRQRLFVYDKEFNLVFEKEFIRDVKSKLFKYENIDINDETGAVYLLGKVFKSASTKKKGMANYHFELHKLTADDQKEVSFEPDENFIGSLFTVRGKHSISCAGFYSEKNDARYKGVVRFNLDPKTLEVTTESYMPFSDTFLEDKYGKVKDKELKDLHFRSAFITEDEAIVLNAEEYQLRTHSHMTNSGTVTSTTHHFNDIVSVKMSADGELLWARNINKKQSTASNPIDYLSFSSTVIGDDTYIFINCSDRIRSLSNDRIEFRQSKAKNSNLYAIKIDKEGNYTFENILSHKDSEVAYCVKQGIHTSLDGKEMVFIGSRKSKKQFLKINI